MQPAKTTAGVSAHNTPAGVISHERAIALRDRAASDIMEIRRVRDKRGLLDRIRRELQELTEPERQQVLLWLKEEFDNEKRRRF